MGLEMTQLDGAEVWHPGCAMGSAEIDLEAGKRTVSSEVAIWKSWTASAGSLHGRAEGQRSTVRTVGPRRESRRCRKQRRASAERARRNCRTASGHPRTLTTTTQLSGAAHDAFEIRAKGVDFVGCESENRQTAESGDATSGSGQEASTASRHPVFARYDERGAATRSEEDLVGGKKN